MTDLAHSNRDLAQKLNRLIVSAPVEPALAGADAIVTHIEVNDRHGVGVLLRRLFGDWPNILSIRSRNMYGGQQEFGALSMTVSHRDKSRDQVLWNMLHAMRGSAVRRILCVPYFPDDVLNAVALKDLYGVPMCTYLMDDQNVLTSGIPDRWMEELLKKSSLRLAISQELVAAYEQKYGQKVWLMPPVAPDRLIPDIVQRPSFESASPVLVGNIWGQRWLELLRRTVRGSGIKLRWFNNGEFPWLPCSREELAAEGIVPQPGPTSEETLVGVLREAPFAVMPSGTLDDSDDRRMLAQLSLPSRIPFILATSHTPVLVLGDPETAAARFVRASGTGLVAGYESRAFADSVARLTDPELNLRLRETARALSRRYSDRGAAEWIWKSLELGRAADERFG